MTVAAATWLAFAGVDGSGKTPRARLLTELLWAAGDGRRLRAQRQPGAGVDHAERPRRAARRG
jgi:thymidylate kinase